MAKYLTLYNFTDQGIRAVKESPGRLQAGIEQAEAAGVKILGAWYIEGAYDLVVLSEAANEKAATAVTLAIAAQGNVRTTTMRAWDPADFAEIVGMIP